MQYADPARARLLATRWLFAVDPGLRHPAAAVFSRGVLVAASRVTVPAALAKLDRAERCRRIARLIANWCLGHGKADTLITEWPQVYSASKSKGDPNNLLPLAAVGAAVAAILDVETISPLPCDWIGSLPKSETGDPWSSPRGKFLSSRLTPLERSWVVPSHDALDACGLGLWALGRLERVLPGTT